MEPGLLVIMALGFNALAMGPWADHPRFSSLVHAPEKAIRIIERKLNRPGRPLSVRRQRGFFLLGAVLLMALALGTVVTRLHLRPVIFAFLVFLLPLRPTWDRAHAIASALKSGNIAAARLCLKNSVWRHYALLDDHALARAAIEILAVHFSEKIVAPVFWYLFLGIPGLLMEKAIYLMQETLCQPMSAENGFSQPVAMLHRVVNYIPSRIAALLWLPTLIFLPLGQSFSALKSLLKHVAGMDTPEQLSVQAASCVLRLSLGGTTSVYTQSQWCGIGSAKATAGDVTRALYLFGLLQLFLGAGLCL